MKLLAISGSRVNDGNMEALVREAMTQTENFSDVEYKNISLSDKKIKGCIHCNWCIKKQSEGKFCSIKDDMTHIYSELINADGILLASPAHFGRLSGLMANMIDRMRVFVHGNEYAGRLKNKIGGALAIAYYRGGGIDSTLSSINILFFTLQMIVATSGLYQLGAGAYTSIKGEGQFKKEPRHIVLEDDYGVASARMLVDRMIELSKLVTAGQSALKDR